MNNNCIPKKIHYCWFGGKPLTDEAKKCIESWKKFCPDYEIIEWNEKNYNVNKNSYTKYTFENKKYAFLTDYVRLDVVNNEGGVYLDTDVELLKPLDPLLSNRAYIGMETIGNVNTGQGFGSMKNNQFLEENMKFYENYNFLDKKGNFKKIICVEVTTNILKKYGLKPIDSIQELENVTIYPVEYFCPLKIGTNKLTITSNSYSIHHFNGSWKANNGLLRKVEYYTIPVKSFIKKKFPSLISLMKNSSTENSEKLSIIIPMYNSYSTIPLCLDSILKQINNDIEVIVIDDGSTDGSAEIVKKYAEKYKHVRLFRTKNMGPSAARNLGIEKAKGSKIIFVDSDDEIRRGGIKLIQKEMRDSFVMMGYIEAYKRARIIHIPRKRKSITKEQAIKMLYCDKNIRGYSVNKIYDAKVIKKFDLHFNEKIRYCEDLYFNKKYIEQTYQNIDIVSKAHYLYKIRKNSLARSNTSHSGNISEDNLLNDSIKNRIKCKYSRLFSIYMALKEKMLGVYD